MIAYDPVELVRAVAIGGGFAGRHPADLVEFIRRVPDGAVLTIEASMRAVTPMNAIGIALGTHVRVGNEDNLWRHKGERMSS
ncbi:3-keto-5-aminohexanoate cleavage protein [Streptomyces sparsogenes]|uniref:3-keto-5-aminohexanoate cleavage protein n=1 Tax=Streptomyces sparsogenes TaxID=67365 RepID=UPI0033DAC184